MLIIPNLISLLGRARKIVLSSTLFTDLKSALLYADGLKRQGHHLAALHSLREAVLKRFSILGETTIIKPTPIDMLAIEALADLAVLFNQNDAADDLLAGIGAWYGRAGNRYFADYIAIKRVHLALDRGHLRNGYQLLREMRLSIGNIEALDLSEAGLEHWEGQIKWPDTQPIDRAILYSRLYLEMGRVLCGFGQYRDAVTALERGLAHAAGAKAEIIGDVTSHLKLARAMAQLEQGELARARSELNELAGELKDQLQPGLYIRHLELYGKLHLLGGHFGEALEKFRQALQTCAAFGFDSGALAASLNLAHVLIYLNQTSIAGEILDKTRAQAERLKDRATVIRAGFLLQLAQARGHSLAGSVPIAPSVSEAWGVINDSMPGQSETNSIDPFDLPQSDNYLSFFEDRALGFHWYLGRRDFAGAAIYLSEITEVFETSDSDLVRLRLHLMHAMLAYYGDDLRRAGLMFDEVRPALLKRGLKPELWQAQRFLGWCWTRLSGHEGRARQKLEEETQKLLEEMTASLSVEDQAIFLLNKWTEDEEYLAGEIHRLALLKAELETGPWLLRLQRRWRLMKHLHRLSLHIDRYKDALAKHGARQEGRNSAAEEETSPIFLWRRLWSHPRDRATLAFLILPDQVFILRAGWLSLDFGISPITRLQIRHLVRRWHEMIRRHMENNRGLGALPSQADSGRKDGGPTTPAELSYQGLFIANHLAEALQIPTFLDSLAKEIRALTIVPDDSLHGFPFAMITHRGQHLIERYALSLAFESNGHRIPAKRLGASEALVVGVSRDSLTGIPQLAARIPPLPGAPKEITDVAEWFERHHVKVFRLDDSAMEFEPAKRESILKQLPQVNLFHIACHGFFKADAPDQSGMVLIPQRDQVELLSLRELSNLDLADLQHATLSSCWSADNFILPGRWIISLPETLWRAGAQSVLGCLWVANDDLTVAFMRNFYKHLETLPRDEALRVSQLACLRQELPDCKIEDQSNPLYWAGYNLYGNHAKLRL